MGATAGTELGKYSRCKQVGVVYGLLFAGRSAAVCHCYDCQLRASTNYSARPLVQMDLLLVLLYYRRSSGSLEPPLHGAPVLAANRDDSLVISGEADCGQRRRMRVPIYRSLRRSGVCSGEGIVVSVPHVSRRLTRSTE